MYTELIKEKIGPLNLKEPSFETWYNLLKKVADNTNFGSDLYFGYKRTIKEIEKNADIFR